MTTTHKRAKKGREIDTNGEFYEGGKFIAATDRAKKHGSGPKKTGKQENCPLRVGSGPGGRFTVDLQPLAGTVGVESSHPESNQAAEWAERCNNGERWFRPE